MTTKAWAYSVHLYNSAIDDDIDPRTQSWPLVYSPVYPLAIVAVYVYLCWNARTLTKNLPAYDLRPLLIAYNAALVLLSLYMLYEFFATAYLAGYDWRCQKVDFSSDDLPMRLASVNWLYYFSKYIELAETLMFALRKKYNQISFLHVYHHSSMIMLWWITVKYLAGGLTFLFGGVNCTVHVVMYCYYLLSAIGPHMRKYLWWKKYITVMQLVQFMFILTICPYVLLTDCGYSKWHSKITLVYGITLTSLFLNFYIKTYLKAKKQKPSVDNSSASLKSD